MTPDRAWKATERHLAARLGGKRGGPTGKVDIVHPLWAIEVKERKRPLPAWLKGALAQAQSNAKPDQLPIAILHELGSRHDEDIVLIRLKDFEDWNGPLAGRLKERASEQST